MSRTAFCDFLVLIMAASFAWTWLIWDIAHWECSDPRYHASLRWGGVECRR